ncbi:DNA polymerase III subunit delta' [Candidatus Parcubacteria bacterium]|nr:DNA polymerase III subunit delta' [Patescibacteria group bacterium]MBU4481973.1 DNA polymerase III subunit delta' [Patescibacteria group bacterium]MCG2686690.1 DNA polymerase III subunit delta' [Candidatus Parcubacteria bacterium]
MFNWQIIGHQNIIDFLESSILNDKLSHAYLFYGPKQLGKKTLVKKLIQNLMCYTAKQNANIQIPCNECDHCRQINKNIHPDVIWLKKESDKKNITIDQIRRLEERLSVHSFFKVYKIAIIENAENLNLASANALLKTLEEPTPCTVIILIADKIHSLPATILSRAQQIKFLPVAQKEIYDYLLSQNVERAQAINLACVSSGRPGRALIFLRSQEIWQAYLSQLNLFLSLMQTSRVSKIKFAEKFLKSKDSLLNKINILIPLLNLWQLILRDLMLSKLQQNDKIINTMEKDRIDSLSQKYGLMKLVDLQKNIEQTKKLLGLNVNPRLVLENLLLAF